MTRRLALALLTWAAFQVAAHAAESDIQAEIKEQIAIVKDNRQGRERFRALQRLKKLGQDAYEAAPILAKLIQNPAEDIKYIDKEAIRTLAYLGPAAAPAIPALVARLDSRLPYCDDAIHTLGVIGEPAVKHLLKSLADRRPYIRRNACDALGGMHPVPESALRPLLALLQVEKDREVKLAAIRAIGEMGPAAKPAIPMLCALMQRDKELRGSAVVALGRMGSTAKRASGLIRRYLRDKEPHVGRCAAVALFRISPTKSSASLVRSTILGAKDDSARTGVLRQLRGAGQSLEPMVPFLVTCLRHKALHVRYAAVDLLCEVRTDRPEVVPALKAALKTDNKEFARRLRIVLAVNGEDAEATARKRVLSLAHRDVRSGAYQNLVKIGKPAVPALTGCLGSETLFVRGLAVQVLGEIGPDAEEALPALREAYENRDRTAKYSWTDHIPEAIKKIEAKAASPAR